MKIRRTLTIVLALVLSVSMLAACSPAETTSTTAAPSESSSGEGTTAEANPVAVSEWEIPVLSAVTGPVAFVGEPAAWAAEYAAEIINADGGIRGVPVKVEVYDDEFSAEIGAQIASTLVDDSIFILGCLAAPVSLAIGQIVYDAQVPNVGSYSYQGIRDDYAPYVYGYMSDSEEGDLDMCTMWCDKFDYESIVFFYTPSDSSQSATKEKFEAELPGAGIEIAGYVEIETGTLDVGSAAIQALNYGADAYYIVSRKDEAAKIINELRDRGVENGEQIGASFAAYDSGLIDLCGENAEGIYIWNKLDPTYSGEVWQALSEAYVADMESDPVFPPIRGFYDSMIALKQCFEELEITGDPAKADDERAAIAEWFYNSPEIEGCQGTFYWENGKMMTSPSVFTVKDGQFTAVE